MACRKFIMANANIQPAVPMQATSAPVQNGPLMGTVFFGVDSATRADTVLQHDLSQFEWVRRNKLYPNFWGRYINGENAFTAEEARFLHSLGCKIAPIFDDYDKAKSSTELQGEIDAKKAFIAAAELGVKLGNIIFLKVDLSASVASEYMLGFAKSMLGDGYIPGFYANTNGNFDFSHQFSRGYQANPEVFSQCHIWATSPSLTEYFETTNAHLIYPDYWGPHCPSCMTQDQVAIWQYGARCHPINDYQGNPTFFNISIMKDASILVNRMF